MPATPLATADIAPSPEAPRDVRRRRWPVVAAVLLGLVALSLAAAWQGLRALVPRVTEEEVRTANSTTIEREAPASFLVTGTLDATATARVANTQTFLPGLLDLDLGTSEAVVRVPGRIAYGFDVRTLTPDHIDLLDDGTVEVTLPPLTVFSVEPDLARMDVQTTRGWARSQESASALEGEALRGVQGALRQQGRAALASGSLDARQHTATALAAMLRPSLVAAGIDAPRFRFRLSPTVVEEIAD